MWIAARLLAQTATAPRVSRRHAAKGDNETVGAVRRIQGTNQLLFAEQVAVWSQIPAPGRAAPEPIVARPAVQPGALLSQ